MYRVILVIKTEGSVGKELFHQFACSSGSGAAEVTYCAFYDKSMKFGTVIPSAIPISSGRGSSLAHIV